MNSLLIDIGGTKTNICLAKEDSHKNIELVSSEIISTTSNPEHIIQKILSICQNSKIKIENASLSLPGKWSKEGVLEESINLKEWIGYPFIESLKQELGIENIIWESDVICGGLGEYNEIAKIREEKDFSLLYLNLGTGFGASFIKNGKPFKSNKGLTLRMHKMVLPYGDEIYSSVDFLSGNSITQDTPYKSTEELFVDYKNGNIEAIDLISKAQTQLAAWLINLNYLLSPDLIVLNGGLTYDFEVICEEAIDLANEDLENQIKIIPSQLKEMATIYGAFTNINLALAK
jgi:predicted NBD/HSP70 family sugar kinase